MTDQIIYADMPVCDEAKEIEGRSWCLLRREFCNLIAVCPLGYVKEGK